MKIEEAWDLQLHWSAHGSAHAPCLLDLRARVEALEQRAAAPAPAPAADRLKSLQEVMREAYVLAGSDGPGFTAGIDAVADWLAARGCAGSADMLRSEARRAREGA